LTCFILIVIASMTSEQVCSLSIYRMTCKNYDKMSVSEISHRTIALLVVIARPEVPRQSP
ncbi:MAG: hypothetical protein SO003_04720, partial [Candidatus Borkfalkiaceae bacterium]|nr:hypothetical protein [Christensenellaceae bacterium]